MSALDLQIPDVFLPFLKRSRYKAAYGGRGSGKSHMFALLCVIRMLEGTTHIVCLREVQSSIRESVKKLIEEKIEELGVGHMFEVLEGEIRGRNGSQVIFKGLQSYSSHNIKSLEGFDIAWIEEAATISETAWKMLRPTIRKEGSEIWCSWNPRFETDCIDKFFRGGNPPEDSIIIRANWYDNPFFGKVLMAEKDADYESDPELADNVWDGGYNKVTAGSYHARLLAKLDREGHVGNFPHDPLLPVFTSWDIGISDFTAIWFYQVHDMSGTSPKVHIIDFFEAGDMGVQDILNTALPEYSGNVQDGYASMLELGRPEMFDYFRHFFPHDVGQREWGNGGRTRLETLIDLGVPARTIHRGVACNPENRINAVRQLLPHCFFNNTKRVQLGLTHLRRYSKRFNEQLGVYMGPLHDEHSHAHDAFGEFAVNMAIRPKIEKKVESDRPSGWLPAPPAPTERNYSKRIALK